VRDFERDGATKFYWDYAAGFVEGAWTALVHQDRMITEYERLYPNNDDSPFWFFKVAYGLEPKEVTAREAETGGAG
jgi:hypothetical protein